MLPLVLTLFTLDCGTLHLADVGPFSDTGEHWGEPAVMEDPCFLIRHGDQYLLWDTGVGDDVAAGSVAWNKDTWTARRTLISQLSELGLTPRDVTYVGLSHLHVDHTGNVSKFPGSTLIIDPRALTWAKTKPYGVWPSLPATLAKMKQVAAPGDLDVFGDGTVLVLDTPGHAPGHKSLLVKLHSGAVILSGDLFHSKENFENDLVPSFNASRADTLASMQRVKKLAKHFGARVVVQHEPSHVRAMPVFPKPLQ